MTKKPLLINNLDFAISEQVISGNIELSTLQRLNDLLAVTSEQQAKQSQLAQIQYTLKGAAKIHSQPSLHLLIDAELPASCQRCLSEMSVLLKLEFDYLISDAEPAEFDGNDEIDWLQASREFNVSELIEDELLIAFPIAPLHSAEQQNECIEYNKQSGEKPKPFAVLKDFAKKSS